jgi:hypothetical protein
VRDTPAAFRKIWPQFFTAAYAADKVSLMSSLYTHRYDRVDHRALGAMPLVVLSAEHAFDTDTPAGVQFWQAYKKDWFARHEALAHLSLAWCAPDHIWIRSRDSGGKAAGGH